MLTIVAIVVAVLLAIVVALAATKPDSFHVERSIDIQAPSERVYALINDFQQFPKWSPYEKLDPAMKRTFTGPQAGIGAVYGWSGNGKAGEGSMEIVEATPPARIGMRLEFKRPFAATNQATFSMVPQGSATRTTWALDGPMPFVSKVFSVFVDLDRMVGKDFEEGLANLKALAEKPAS